MSFTLNLRREIPGNELGGIIWAAMLEACPATWDFKKWHFHERSRFESQYGVHNIPKFTCSDSTVYCIVEKRDFWDVVTLLGAGMKYGFACRDSIFAVIEPKKNYSELELFINVGLECLIEDETASSFDVIENEYFLLLDRLDTHLGYKTRTFYRD